MSTAIMIAQILGPIYLVISLAIWMNGAHYKKVFEGFLKNEAVMYLGGLIGLVVGILIVQAHNVWVWNWTVVVTLIGWVAIAKGVHLIVFPEKVEMWKKFMLKGNGVMIAKWSTLVLGGFLTWMGYFA